MARVPAPARLKVYHSVARNYASRPILAERLPKPRSLWLSFACSASEYGTTKRTRLPIAQRADDANTGGTASLNFSRCQIRLTAFANWSSHFFKSQGAAPPTECLGRRLSCLA